MPSEGSLSRGKVICLTLSLSLLLLNAKVKTLIEKSGRKGPWPNEMAASDHVIGRDGDISALVTLLQGKKKVVNVTGEHGIGKMTVAKQVNVLIRVLS